MSYINKLQEGKIINLSKSQIVFRITSMPVAKKNLSEIDYERFWSLFKEYRKQKEKIPMDLNTYLEVCNSMIDEFEKIAPYELLTYR